MYDCAIIGGGPAGLSAALVLGRARRKVIVFDDNQARNRVIRNTHGFITRDGIPQSEFKLLALHDLAQYDSVDIRKERVDSIRKMDKTHFEIETENGNSFTSNKLLLATGLKDAQPNIPMIERFYGTSLFSCPYCDGWEMRDRPLAVIADKNVYKLAKEVYTWSQDVAVFTNGEGRLEEDERDQLLAHGIQVYEDIITGLEGENGQLQSIRLEDGTFVHRSGGFVTPLWSHSNAFGKELGCELNDNGGLLTDTYGRTTVWNVYAAGDAAHIVPAQLIIAAGTGSAAAIGINGDLTNEFFSKHPNH